MSSASTPAGGDDRAPVIPPAPPGGGRPRRRGDSRWVFWLAALAAGSGAGFAAYQLVPFVYEHVDLWLARAMG